MEITMKDIVKAAISVGDFMLLNVREHPSDLTHAQYERLILQARSYLQRPNPLTIKGVLLRNDVV